MPRLALDKDFLLRDLPKLERPVRERVTEAFGKFAHATHAGSHLEKLTNVRDPRLRTIRIDRSLRGVVVAPDGDDTFTLLKVLPHDDAYAWARSHAATVNTASGRFEVRDVNMIESVLPELSKAVEDAPTRLFDHLGDDVLDRFGVDEQTRAFARVLTDVIQLEAARTFLPQHQWDVLYGLAAGLSPDEVWAELGVPDHGAHYDPNDLAAAIERSGDRIVLVEGPDELMEIVRRPFDLWRIYLHPVQRQVAYGDFSGPARVTGGPGTGKTVVALHRAKHLAESGEGPVLLTTFTSTLAASLEVALELLVDSAEVRERITVRHIDQVATEVYRQRHGHPKIIDDREQRRVWTSLIERFALPFTETFLMQEWRQVVLAQQIGTAREYVAARRQGRGRPLGLRQREVLWPALAAFHQILLERGVRTHETICVEATRLLGSGVARPYRHVVVDEAQDLSPARWRLLRALVEPGRNDMFIAGDSHQRIYDDRVSLREVGVRIAGRSGRLTVNYRTTAEILVWSMGVLRGERIDDLDGGVESLTGCRSELHGYPPTLHGARTRDDELGALTTRFREWLDAGVDASEIAVATRSNKLADVVVEHLTQERIAAHSLARPGHGVDGVAVGTMHRMKGLEFRCLAVVGVGRHQMPPPNAVTPLSEDEATHRHDLQRERCLLFVACTRAREGLYVSWHGEPSPFLTPLRAS
ncbi:MAG: AAA family ATPase [Streptosporangiales bacterium]|nr:AAA family ATPase [Streptosporangiales bacterium]